ncbi:MAG: hypothetical protein WC539_01690 [Nitrospirota bacterium]
MFIELMTIPHVIFGVLGIITAFWLAVEAANCSVANYRRVKIATVCTTGFMWLAYLFGGWWYVVYYGVGSRSDKAIILSGPWKWAHTFFMEAKEHIFFMIILLSILLPVVVFRNEIFNNRNAKNLTIVIGLTIAVLGLSMESFGAMITKGVKMGLLEGK